MDYPVEAIYAVLNAINPIHEYMRYLWPYNNCYAFFMDGAKDTPLKGLDKHKSIGSYSLVQLGDLSRTTFLNQNIAKEYCTHTLRGDDNVFFPQAFSNVVGFDSNMFSSIRRTLRNPEKDCYCYEMLKYIKEIGYIVAPNPNIYEHVYKESAMEGGQEGLIDSLRYYFAYERISLSELNDAFSTGVITNEKDNKRATALYEKMKEVHTHSSKWDEFGVDAIYCMLLETDILKWDPDYKANPEQRYVKLFEFVNREICVYLENVLYYCIKYLNNSNDVSLSRFFGKMNITAKNLLQGIESMAWDFWHILSIPLEMVNYYKMYGFPNIYSLVTRDRGFANTISFNPIKRLVVFDNRPFVKYVHTIEEFDFLPEGLLDSISSNVRYRNTHVSSVNFKSIAKEKEKELLFIKSTTK